MKHFYPSQCHAMLTLLIDGIQNKNACYYLR